MLTNETIDGLLGITESYQAPQVMLEYMLDNSRREDLFRSFIEIEWNMDYEWFSGYFEAEHADRKVKKQDFTPQNMHLSYTGTSFRNLTIMGKWYSTGLNGNVTARRNIQRFIRRKSQ